MEWQGRMFPALGPEFPGIPDAFPATEGLLPHEHQEDLDDKFPAAVACNDQGDIDRPEPDGDRTVVRGNRIGQGLVKRNGFATSRRQHVLK